MVKKIILFFMIGGLLVVPHSLVGLTKGQKWGIGLGVAAGVLGASRAISKYKERQDASQIDNEWQKLYDRGVKLPDYLIELHGVKTRR